MSVNWDTVRAEFPALSNWTYLNTATFGQIPRRAAEAAARHFAHRDEFACWNFLEWFDDMDRIREKVGRLINCSAQDIAFVANTSTALGILLAGIEWRVGDRVLTLEHEFPNNLYAPGALAHLGVQLIQCPWERFYDAVDSRTRLVAISSANYNNGFAPPLEEIGEFLRRRDILLFVDGTQSVGAMQCDIAKIQPDMFAVHGYKWMISPNGAGFFYIKPSLRARLAPNNIGWRSHKDWRNVDNLHHGVPELPDSAERYEGGSMAFTLLYAMEASIDLMLEIGTEVIEQRVLDLAAKTREILCVAGAAVQEFRSPIVAARFPNRDVSDLARALKEERVLVAARRGSLRVSPHFYNNETDLEVLAGALRKKVG
jgi:cysteine desulfurase/selenocysteine lyase